MICILIDSRSSNDNWEIERVFSPLVFENLFTTNLCDFRIKVYKKYKYGLNKHKISKHEQLH